MEKRYCYNITFLVQAERRAEQMDWISRSVDFLSKAAGFTGLSAKLATVVAVPGMSDYGREETSVTAQFEFAEAEQARLWGDTHFATLAGAYSRSFGQQAYVMPSIIEQWSVWHGAERN